MKEFRLIRTFVLRFHTMLGHGVALKGTERSKVLRADGTHIFQYHLFIAFFRQDLSSLEAALPSFNQAIIIL